MKKMTITFLGTGTSQGVPIINCTCNVCQSRDLKNKRLRSSVTIQTDSTIILIDTTPDLRQQLLRDPIPRIDAILYTHAHADHVYGIDDIRRFNIIQEDRIHAFGTERTINRLKHIFGYAFQTDSINYGLPNLEANVLNGDLCIKDLQIIPIPLKHGNSEVLGFRIGGFAYCTDVNYIPPNSYRLLKNLDVLVLDALREIKHPTHFSLEEALSEAKKIDAAKTYFIHMSHDIEHESHSTKLPENIYFSYDGLRLDLTLEV
jgi:phosphoribosyl 1,2-cyclic phosphate phosphodiesterase